LLRETPPIASSANGEVLELLLHSIAERIRHQVSLRFSYSFLTQIHSEIFSASEEFILNVSVLFVSLNVAISWDLRHAVLASLKGSLEMCSN
jgi:hypothetical protein